MSAFSIKVLKLLSVFESAKVIPTLAFDLCKYKEMYCLPT